MRLVSDAQLIAAAKDAKKVIGADLRYYPALLRHVTWTDSVKEAIHILANVRPTDERSLEWCYLLKMWVVERKLYWIVGAPLSKVNAKARELGYVTPFKEALRDHSVK